MLGIFASFRLPASTMDPQSKRGSKPARVCVEAPTNALPERDSVLDQEDGASGEAGRLRCAGLVPTFVRVLQFRARRPSLPVSRWRLSA